jgi:2,3-bisphosphoglycerate-independent phosphoglycerate mutase
MAKLIFIFVDGIGIGNADDSNPFFASKADFLPLYQDSNGLPFLPESTPFKGIDACLGINGMPMSATGQTTLFTGINTPSIFNEHRDSYPDKQMRKIIRDKNIFSQLINLNFKPRFLNAFPGSAHLFSPANIQLLNNGEFYFSQRFKSLFKRSISVTTSMMVSNNMSPFSERDIVKRKALYHDFTNQSLDKEYGIPNFSPELAAEILYNVSQDYDLLLFEYFMTDFYGHGFDIPDCIDLIQQLNRLIKHLISYMDEGSDTLLITSDHGNLEDGTTQYHTYNPVPLITWGYRSKSLRNSIDSIADVKPAVIEWFKKA